MPFSRERELWSHWARIAAAVLAGVAAAGLAYGALKLAGATALIGWDAAAVVYLLGVGFLFLTNDEAKVRARAKLEDENRAVLMSLILLAVAASVGAMVVALHDAHAVGKGGLPPWLVALEGATLVLSWLVVQALFTLHYTHRYFGDRNADGSDDGGIDFPGEPPRSYRDFLYVAICVGATCQVSDFDITTGRFRNLVTVHALISFAFNTTVLALGINIIGNLVGGQ
jgi:uncharacterized membrane protein